MKNVINIFTPLWMHFVYAIMEKIIKHISYSFLFVIVVDFIRSSIYFFSKGAKNCIQAADQEKVFNKIYVFVKWKLRERSGGKIEEFQL